MAKSPFRADDKFMYCEADKMEFLIPNSFFTKKPYYGYDLGEQLQVFGLFPVSYWYGSAQETKTMNNPYYITIQKSMDTVERRDLPGQGETECRIMTYVKGQKVMESSIVEDSENAVTYLRNFINLGNVPKTISYSKSPSVWTKNQEMSGVNFGIRSEVEEIILALMYRDKKDMSKKFATVYGSDLNVSEFDFSEASIRQICQYASTFTSLTFEDFDSMVTTSLNRSRNKGKETYTPVEDILKL